MPEFATFSADRPPGVPASSSESIVVVRDAAECDVPALALTEAGREGKLPRDCERSLRALLADPSGHLTLAERGGRAIGFEKSRFPTPPADAPPHHVPEGWYLGGL